jgi:hypothetical protein
MGLLVFMYLVCSLRTNVVFFLIFFFLDIALLLLTGAYWKAAEGDAAAYERLTVVGQPRASEKRSILADMSTGVWRLCFCLLHTRMVLALCTATPVGRISIGPTSR